MQQKKKKTIKPVKKPFLQGKPVDGSTAAAAIKFFFSLFGMALVNVLLGSMVSWSIQWLNILFNGALLLVIYGVYYQNGANRGVAAVNQGEILWQRRENGHQVDQKEQSLCFHPMKGFLIGLLGLLPALVCGLMLALVAQKQYTGLGALPSWIASLQRQTETAGALAIYQTEQAMSMESTLRVIVRLLVMPYVNMVGANNRDALLLLERICILPLLMPAISYGVGYLQGIRLRTQVHTDIALGKRKRAKKEKKRRQARSKEPEQLN